MISNQNTSTDPQLSREEAIEILNTPDENLIRHGNQRFDRLGGAFRGLRLLTGLGRPIGWAFGGHVVVKLAAGRIVRIRFFTHHALFSLLSASPSSGITQSGTMPVTSPP